MAFTSMNGNGLTHTVRVNAGGPPADPPPDDPGEWQDEPEPEPDPRQDLYDRLAALVDGYGSLAEAGSQLTYGLSLEILLAANALQECEKLFQVGYDTD